MSDPTDTTTTPTNWTKWILLGGAAVVGLWALSAMAGVGTAVALTSSDNKRREKKKQEDLKQFQERLKREEAEYAAGASKRRIDGWYVFTSWGGRDFWKESSKKFHSKEEAEAYAARERAPDSGLQPPVRTMVRHFEYESDMDAAFSKPIPKRRRR